MGRLVHLKNRRTIVLAILGLTVIYLGCANWIVVHSTTCGGEFIIQKTSPVQIASLARFCIDMVQSSPKTLCEKTEVIGWALPPEEYVLTPGSEIEVALVFKTENTWYRVRTIPTPRQDVLEVFKLDQLSCRPGFIGVFSPVRMKGGTYRMGVLVQDKGRDLAFSWTARRFVNDRMGFREFVFLPKLYPLGQPEPKGDMKSNDFDTFNITATSVDIEGWAFANTGGASYDQEVLLIISSKDRTLSLTTEKRERKDLRTVFDDQMRVIGEDAGYASRLNPSDLPFGTYRFGVMIREQGRNVAFQWMPNRVLHISSTGVAHVANAIGGI